MNAPSTIPATRLPAVLPIRLGVTPFTGGWAVASATLGAAPYLVRVGINADGVASMHCTCRDFQFRSVRDAGHICKHGRAVGAYEDANAAPRCPGFLRDHAAYAGRIATYCCPSCDSH